MSYCSRKCNEKMWETLPEDCDDSHLYHFSAFYHGNIQSITNLLIDIGNKHSKCITFPFSRISLMWHYKASVFLSYYGKIMLSPSQKRHVGTFFFHKRRRINTLNYKVCLGISDFKHYSKSSFKTR